MEISNTIITITISLLVILTPFGIIVGIILAIAGWNVPDKAKRLRKMIIALCVTLLPIVLLFVTLSLWGLMRIITNTFK